MSSDHKPLWLASDDLHSRFFRAQKPFRFEAVWLKDNRFDDVVYSTWDRCVEGDAMGKVLGKVADCQVQFKMWNKYTFGNIRVELAKKKKLLLKVEGVSMGGSNHGRVKVLTDEIHGLMEKEEVLWHQRAKNDWLKFGDQNTKYFHCRATNRNKRNFISGLKDVQGNWIEGEDQIGAYKVFRILIPIW